MDWPIHRRIHASLLLPQFGIIPIVGIRPKFSDYKLNLLYKIY